MIASSIQTVVVIPKLHILIEYISRDTKPQYENLYADVRFVFCVGKFRQMAKHTILMGVQIIKFWFNGISTAIFRSLAKPKKNASGLLNELQLFSKVVLENSNRHFISAFIRCLEMNRKTFLSQLIKYF